MGPDQADAATRRNRKARTSAQGQPDDVEWNALDRPKRRPVAGNCQKPTALGSQCMPDLPNGGMTAHWKECFTRFLGMKTWKI